MSSDLYNLILEDRDGYLYACVQAEVINLGIAVDYVNESMAHLRQSGATKLLFVRETPMSMSPTQYSIIGSIIINMIPKGVRVALVDHSPVHRMIVDFINSEATEKNRDVRAFDEFIDAEDWLLDESLPSGS